MLQENRLNIPPRRFNICTHDSSYLLWVFLENEMTSFIINILSIIINLVIIYMNYKMDKEIDKNTRKLRKLLED